MKQKKGRSKLLIGRYKLYHGWFTYEIETSSLNIPLIHFTD